MHNFLEHFFFNCTPWNSGFVNYLKISMYPCLKTSVHKCSKYLFINCASLNSDFGYYYIKANFVKNLYIVVMLSNLSFATFWGGFCLLNMLKISTVLRYRALSLWILKGFFYRCAIIYLFISTYDFSYRGLFLSTSQLRRLRNQLARINLMR